MKREKPDYYDALEFENKRRAERVAESSGSRERRDTTTRSKGRGRGRSDDGRGERRRRGSKNLTTGRATLTWKKGAEGGGEEDGSRKKKRRKTTSTPATKEDSEEDLVPMEYISPEKGIVFLSEINRKLSAVICQPG